MMNQNIVNTQTSTISASGTESRGRRISGTDPASGGPPPESLSNMDLGDIASTNSSPQRLSYIEKMKAASSQANMTFSGTKGGNNTTITSNMMGTKSVTSTSDDNTGPGNSGYESPDLSPQNTTIINRPSQDPVSAAATIDAIISDHDLASLVTANASYATQPLDPTGMTIRQANNVFGANPDYPVSGEGTDDTQSDQDLANSFRDYNDYNDNNQSAGPANKSMLNSQTNQDQDSDEPEKNLKEYYSFQELLQNLQEELKKH